MFLVFPRTWTVLRPVNAQRGIAATTAARLFVLLTLIIAFAVLPAAAAPFGSADPAGAITISISPTSANMVSLDKQQFTATVRNTTNTAVTWSKSGNGSITSDGLFTAPWITSGTTKTTITVTSKADKTKSA